MDDLYENSRKQLAQLVDWFNKNKSNRNEATTRFQLIDKLFLDCLGWSRNDITLEDNFKNEYTDYMFHIARPVMILEAKKEGNYFELPEGNKKLIYSIKSIIRDNKNLAEAVEQVSKYCQSRGVEIGLVCNGWQIVLFIANRVDGIPPLDGNAYVFPSLEFMLSNFLTIWNVLSKSGIESKKIFEGLLGEKFVALPPKLSSTIQHYPGIKNRNPFQTDLQIISEIVLEDVAKNRNIQKEFLEFCYCKSGALSQYALISKEILRTRYKYLFEVDEQKALVESAIDKKGLAADLTEIIASSLSSRPILLVGDVGVGKSIFINNLIIVEATTVFKNSITLKVDLGSQIILATSLEEAVLEQLKQQLLSEYQVDIEAESFIKGVYHGELLKFKRGIYKPLFEKNDDKAIEKEIEFLEKKINDKPEHIKQSLNHISKARKKQIIIFIDNVDQRDHTAQQKAFLIAQEIAENWPVTVFLALRPDTFHWSLKHGALSGYHPKAFTISPPRIDDVLEKRLEFAQKITKGEIFLTRFEGRVKLNLESLYCLIEVLKMSLSNNRNLYEFIDNISNGNVRVAIDFIKNFISSGHVDTKKIVEIYQESENYYIPIHEFLRAIIYGDNIHYNPKSSYIINLLDVKYFDEKEHFLLPIILSLLNAAIKSGQSDGFVDTATVYTSIQSIGFTLKQIDFAMVKLNETKLIETSGRGMDINFENHPTLLRITPTGIYHLEKLLNSFVYMDAIIVDTPIFNIDARERIKNVFNIEERLERAVVFKDYLDSAWRAFIGKKIDFDWFEISGVLKKEILSIKNKLPASSQ